MEDRAPAWTPRLEQCLPVTDRLSRPRRGPLLAERVRGDGGRGMYAAAEGRGVMRGLGGGGGGGFDVGGGVYDADGFREADWSQALGGDFAQASQQRQPMLDK